MNDLVFDLQEVLFINSDNAFVITGLTNQLDGSFVNSATISMVIKTLSGTSLGGPYSFDYVTSSNGNYTGVIPQAVTSGLTNHDRYIVEVTTSYGGNTMFSKYELIALYSGTL